MVAQDSRPEDRGARRLSVLLVEDNQDIRDSTRTVLEHMGHRVTAVANGADGIHQALAVRPHVALVDLGLPGMSGLDVARQLRAALGRDMALVACTGYGDPEDRDRALEAGFDLHLAKPLDWVLLTAWLDQLPR
jgi:CheY-like chemotaxis protein